MEALERIYKEIGETITIARIRKGWTQVELSSALLPVVKLQRTSITLIELGKQRLMIQRSNSFDFSVLRFVLLRSVGDF